MNSSGSYFGSPQPTPTHNRPNNQAQYSTGYQPTPAKTSNGLACAPARPTTFMNQTASWPNVSSSPLQFQQNSPVKERPVHITETETTRVRSTTFRANDQEIMKFFSPEQLYQQGFTEIPFSDDPFQLAQFLPDQNVEIHTTITTVDANRNRHTQSVLPSLFQQRPLSVPSSPTRTPSVTPPHISPQGVYPLAKEGRLPQPWNQFQQCHHYPPSPYNRGGPEGF
ncbi:hypothetical protein [Endozoicomonas atrinae]|uniref:hypothetical protein n=1 Tax=Endozoicomonas atrinae TaxID=1333660 RepID=UPI003B004856